jgi:NADPH-dependent 2,4-dienoyl-CoA reductase/sulfur reductase-like enzyme
MDVTLIERSTQYVSCPMSNEVLGGNRDYATLVQSYDALRKKWGVKVVNAEVSSVDTSAKLVKTAQGKTYAYDRLIVAPGIDLMFDQIKGYDAKAQKTVLHAWKAGPQTLALRKQLEAMKDGGTYVISIPKSPYRCPPGPYERASQVAFYFKRHKPASKVIILDANDSIQSKGKLFQAAWNTYYPGMVDYRPNWNVTEVDAQRKQVTSELGDTVKADVLNIVPPMRGGDIAQKIGLLNVNQRWAGVDWITLESTAVPVIWPTSMARRLPRRWLKLCLVGRPRRC